jgi:hypothetical protein
MSAGFDRSRPRSARSGRASEAREGEITAGEKQTAREPCDSRAIWGYKPRRRPTLPHSCLCSTIGAGELNDRVRDGIGCDLPAIATRKWLGLYELHSLQSEARGL